MDCGDNCSECDDEETCTTCFDDYYLNSDDECDECPDNCSLCVYSATADAGAICTACDDEYVLENGNCDAGCADNCATCDY